MVVVYKVEIIMLGRSYIKPSKNIPIDTKRCANTIRNQATAKYRSCNNNGRRGNFRILDGISIEEMPNTKTLFTCF